MGRSAWIVNPYGTLPGEPWVTYRSTMLAEHLASRGYDVTQFISNFEHRSKTFREGPATRSVRDGYTIEILPSTRYDSHISLERIRYERTFARQVAGAAARRPPADVIVLAEPALCYYDILLRRVLLNGHSALVLDVIDIWPELFELAIPRPLRVFSGIALAPLYAWRRRLYRHADAVVAVAESYLEIARGMVDSARVPLEVVYWSYDERQDAAVTGAQEGTIVDALIGAKQADDVWALYAGTLGENYDIRSIIDVSRRLPARLRGRARLKFIIAGDGPLADACRNSVSDAFMFVGRLGAAEIAKLQRHADIALSTYRGESTVAMPIKAFDYLRHGLPMVNSLGRDLGRLVHEHEVGINYEPADAASLAAAVERLALDPSLRRRMSANARRLADDFAPDRQYGRFVGLLDRLAQRRARIQ